MAKERRKKLALCYGTRPQVVKASVLLRTLNKDWEVQSIDTGQHYDWELHGIHYRALQVPKPDRFLKVGSSDHSTQTSEIISRAAATFRDDPPDIVVVIGDTNSTLGCALAAAKLSIPVVHVEAGLRAMDLMMPEEINRRLVDELSTLLCTPSKAATEFLEGRVSAAQQVIWTGDVARDVLEKARRTPTVDPAPWKTYGITPPFVLATLHRAELTENRRWLARALEALGRLPYPVFFPVHPRTQKALDRFSLQTLTRSNVLLSKPVSYIDMVQWIQGSFSVITDSGGLQREAYWLGVPCITLRKETEWLETVEEGANLVLPPEEADLLPSELEKHPGLVGKWEGEAYGTDGAAEAVRKAVRLSFS